MSWQQRSSRLVYQNAFFRVRHDEVVAPTGRFTTYGVVETAPAIGVVALTAEGAIYLVGQDRYPHRSYSWEIPEGGGRPGESVEEGAARELAEETGLRAQRWTSLGTCHTSNCFTDETGYLFLAEGLTQGEAAPDGTEQLAVRVVGLEEAVEMERRGEIQDALTIIALYRVRDLLATRRG